MADQEKSNQDEDQEDYPWTYDANPVPWWLALIWISFFVWGIAYLVLYLI